MEQPNQPTSEATTATRIHEAITNKGRHAIINTAWTGGRNGHTFPITWAKVRDKWQRCEVGACPYDPVNLDAAWVEGKRLAQESWNLGRISNGLPHVILVD